MSAPGPARGAHPSLAAPANLKDTVRAAGRVGAEQSGLRGGTRAPRVPLSRSARRACPPQVGTIAQLAVAGWQIDEDIEVRATSEDQLLEDAHAKNALQFDQRTDVVKGQAQRLSVLEKDKAAQTERADSATARADAMAK